MPKGKRKRRSKSKSGYIGVSKLPNGKYRAAIKINGKSKSLGTTHDTATQAAKAYDKAAIKLRKPFSKLNYPKKAPVGYTPKQQALAATNTIGYRGVYKHAKKFRAIKSIDGKQTHIGIYDTLKEAAIAYDRDIHKTNRPKSLLNFPDHVHNLNVEPYYKKYDFKKTPSSTAYRGVQKAPNGIYNAAISTNGKTKCLGSFDTAKKAALAYDQAAIKKGNKNPKLNFPDGLPKLKKIVTYV